MEEFISLLNSMAKLTEQEVSFLRDNIKERVFTKRQMILREGDIAKKFFFIAEGFIRLFYINDKGEEKTAFFYPKMTFASDFEGYVKGTPTNVNMQAMEDTRLIIISKEEAEFGLGQLENMSLLAVRFMEEEMILHQRLIKSILTETPEQRYLKLISESPEIIQKVPSKHIASYLGISPESLSRIRSKIM
jgi:CRP-like cAMP-binding protein